MGKPTYNELERRLCALLKEIDHLKAHHQSARSKLQYLEDTLNNTNTPTFLKRSDFTYIFINREFERLGKIDAENVQGKDDFMIFPQAVAELFRAQDEEVVKSKKVMEFEETIPLQDGMHSFITAKFPLFDDEGDVDAVGGVCTDITARKKAESRLREAEEKYRSIVEHSPLGILLIDQNGIITTCNKKLAEILQTEVEKIIGLDLIHSLNDARVRSATSLALSGRLVQYEGWYQSFTSGKSAYLHGVFSPIYSTDQSVTSAIGIIDDSTARKTAEDALLKAHGELERRVKERTVELDQKTRKLTETNVALEILLEKRDADKHLLEEKVMQNIEKLIYPYLDKLMLTDSITTKEALIGIIRANLEEITSAFSQKKGELLLSLTPAQLQIADLIRNGHTTKEIARLLNLSPSTISCHRQEIRKRLALTNKKVNLQSALSSKA